MSAVRVAVDTSVGEPAFDFTVGDGVVHLPIGELIVLDDPFSRRRSADTGFHTKFRRRLRARERRGVERRSTRRSRRWWSAEEKARVVRECLRPGKRVGEVARRYGGWGNHTWRPLWGCARACVDTRCCSAAPSTPSTPSPLQGRRTAQTRPCPVSPSPTPDPRRTRISSDASAASASANKRSTSACSHRSSRSIRL